MAGKEIIYVLGSKVWESKFDGLLSLVNEYIVDLWEIRKHNTFYDSASGPTPFCLHLGIWLCLKGRGMVSSVKLVS